VYGICVVLVPITARWWLFFCRKKKLFTWTFFCGAWKNVEQSGSFFPAWFTINNPAVICYVRLHKFIF